MKAITLFYHQIFKLAILSFLIPAAIHAEITNSSISSENASYDGNALILRGSVKLDHALGQLTSGYARLSKELEEGPFTAVHLRDNVLISLKNRGKILCGKADFDFNALKGTLIPKPGDMVRFVNFHSGPLSLASREADIEFSRDDSNLKVAKIEAKNTVQLTYGKDFFLEADTATFSNTKTPYVWASPHCTLTHFEDKIEANRVEVLPDSAKVILSTPSGKLHPSAFSQGNDVQFSCDKLIWEKAPQTLTLKGDVSVFEEGVGDIHCDDEVELRQKEENGKWLLSSITAKGKTELTYKLDVDFVHLLKCYGKMQLDQDRLVLNVTSPPEKPIEYFHDQMKLIADTAELKYEQLGRNITAKQLQLTDNIQLSSLQDSNRCAVADKFNFFPEEKKIILSANPGNNVLFWDREQDLSISAKEVHITRTEKGEKIKGVGNVRFAFSSAENALLKKLFPFYHPTGERP